MLQVADSVVYNSMINACQNPILRIILPHLECGELVWGNLCEVPKQEISNELTIGWNACCRIAAIGLEVGCLSSYIMCDRRTAGWSEAGRQDLQQLLSQTVGLA